MKKFIGILLSVAMLVSAMPVWAATGTTEENLFDKGDVVFTSSSEPQYSTIDGIYDNNENTLTYVNNTGKRWIQAELYTPMQITRVVLTGRHNGANAETGITEGSTGVGVYLSNDPEFAEGTYVELGTTDSSGLQVKEKKEFAAVDTSKYKYIRLMSNAVIVLGEMDVYGYYETFEVDPEREVNLFEQGGVLYSGGGEEPYGDTYQWENAFDGSNTKEVYLSGTCWVQAELSMPMQITRVDVIGRPNHTSSSGIKIFLSLDGNEWVNYGETPSGGILKGEKYSATINEAKKYRYIKLCKGTADVPGGEMTFGEVEVYGYYEAIEIDTDREVNLFKDAGATYSGGGTPYSSNYVWENAFDGTNQKQVSLSGGGWIQAELIAPMQITRVDIVGRPGPASTANMNVWLSKNGTDWILYGKSPTGGFANSTHSININSDNKYKYVRMSLGTPDAPTGTIEFGDLAVYGYLPDIDKNREKNLFDNGGYSYSFNGRETYAPSFSVENAFDGKADTNCYLDRPSDNATPAWIQIELYAPMMVTRVDIKGRYNNADACRGHNIYLSNDPDFGTYYHAGTTGNTSWQNDIKSVSGNLFNEYKYIRICGGTFESSNVNFSLAEIDVYGYPLPLRMEATATLEAQGYDILPCDISKDTSGNVVATTGVINEDVAPVTSPLFIFALYNEVNDVETLVAITTVLPDSIVPGGVKAVNATIPASALTGKTYTKARLFAFDDATNLTPICKSLTVNITN